MVLKQRRDIFRMLVLSWLIERYPLFCAKNATYLAHFLPLCQPSCSVDDTPYIQPIEYYIRLFYLTAVPLIENKQRLQSEASRKA